MTLSKMPYEMTETELREHIATIDYFGEITSFDQLCLDQLHERETGTDSHEYAGVNLFSEKSSATETERADFRSGLISCLKNPNLLNRVLKAELWELSENDREQLERIAENLNETIDLYPASIIEEYATFGYFYADDIAGVIRNGITQKELTELKNATTAKEKRELNDTIEYYETSFIFEKCTDSTAESNELHTEINTVTYTDSDLSFEYGANIETSFIFEKCTNSNKKTIDAGTCPREKWKGFPVSYQIKDKELQQWRKMQKNAPKQAKYAARFTLNDMARDTHKEYQKEAKTTQTARNRTLTRKSITYERAGLSHIDQMYSEVGSSGIATRFTGFGEQEGVRRPKRKRIITKKGRGRKRATLNRNLRMDKQHANVEKLVGKKNLNSERRVFGYMGRLMREKGNLRSIGSRDNTFVLTKDFNRNALNSNMNSGLYRIGKRSGNIARKGKKAARGRDLYLETIQFEPKSKRELRPRKNKMLHRSTNRYMKSARPQQHFGRNMKKQIDFINKRR